MYLTRRSSGYRFQRRIPKNLQQHLGSAPLRLNLGHLTVGEAKKVSRLLAGQVEAVFHGLERMGGDVIVADIRDTIIGQLEEIVSALCRDLEDTHHLHDSTTLALKRKSEVDLKVAEARHLLELGRHQRESQAQIEELGEGISLLRQKALSLASEYKTLKETKTGDGDLAELVSGFSSLSAAVQTLLDGGETRPLMSETLEEWHTVRSGLGIDQKKVDTDYNRLKYFIAFAGDKPVNKYRFLEFQRFANLLARLPGNYVKLPELRNLSQVDAANFNDRLPRAKRHKTLTAKTIDTNYFSPLRMFFREMGAEYEFRSPLADSDIRISSAATESIDRTPFTAEELNVWFAHAASERRGDAKWLPLLGALTGARIAELIFLQKKDIYEVEGGHWVMDLTTDLIGDDGVPIERRIKTKSSRRIIDLHQTFVDVGFIAYVLERPDGWLFPWAFRHGKEIVKKPADAASKRMNGQLRKVGIHKEIETTFHSTRHTAKDIMRTARVDRGTHDIQTGHSLKQVSDKYGSKHLKQDEIEVLVALPLPDGLDLSPYCL